MPERLLDLEKKASHAVDIDELEDLENIAEVQGRFRVYLCPRAEILDEGNLAINVMEEWNVPKSVITKLRSSLGRKLERADTDLAGARGAPRAILEESESWGTYTEDYEEAMPALRARGFFAQL